jgi:GNAT superfamily N-acetyltransferase
MPSSVLNALKTVPIGDIFGRPAQSVYVPPEVFKEYHLRAFNCTVIGEWLDITRFVVRDKGSGHGSRLLNDLDAWERGRGLRICLTPQPYGRSDEMSFNRLLRFYERHGFVMVGEGEWCPEAMFKP